MPPEHAPDRHKAQQAHEEVAHAAGRTTDIGHLAEYDFELIHHILSDFVQIREMRAFAQHRLSKIEALAHGCFHCAAMRLVKGMNFAHAMSSRRISCTRFIPRRSPRSPATIFRRRFARSSPWTRGRFPRASCGESCGWPRPGFGRSGTY